LLISGCSGTIGTRSPVVPGLGSLGALGPGSAATLGPGSPSVLISASATKLRCGSEAVIGCGPVITTQLYVYENKKADKDESKSTVDEDMAESVTATRKKT